MQDILTTLNNDPQNANQFIVTYDAITDDNLLLISSNSFIINNINTERLDSNGNRILLVNILTITADTLGRLPTPIQ